MDQTIEQILSMCAPAEGGSNGEPLEDLSYKGLNSSE